MFVFADPGETMYEVAGPVSSMDDLFNTHINPETGNIRALIVNTEHLPPDLTLILGAIQMLVDDQWITARDFVARYVDEVIFTPRLEAVVDDMPRDAEPSQIAGLVQPNETTYRPGKRTMYVNPAFYNEWIDEPGSRVGHFFSRDPIGIAQTIVHEAAHLEIFQKRDDGQINPAQTPNHWAINELITLNRERQFLRGVLKSLEMGAQTLLERVSSFYEIRDDIATLDQQIADLEQQTRHHLTEPDPPNGAIAPLNRSSLFVMQPTLQLSRLVPDKAHNLFQATVKVTHVSARSMRVNPASLPTAQHAAKLMNR